MKDSMKRASSIALLLVALGATAASAESDWISDSGNVELKVNGDSWYLNNGGPATIRTGTTSSELEVYYHDGNGTRCGYRKHFVDGGAGVILQPTDSTQSSELCPSGRLDRVTDVQPTPVTEYKIVYVYPQAAPPRKPRHVWRCNCRVIR
jgi:hypothetical protein